jgi:hypothetical protein
LEEKQRGWNKVVVPSIVIVVAVLVIVIQRASCIAGSELQARHRAFLDSYVADLHAGRPTQPGVEADESIAALAGASSWEIRGVEYGAGFGGKGDTCWSIETVSSTGQQASPVIGISDDEGPIHVAGWGMQPPCRCPRKRGGSLLC